MGAFQALARHLKISAGSNHVRTGRDRAFPQVLDALKTFDMKSSFDLADLDA